MKVMVTVQNAEALSITLSELAVSKSYGCIWVIKIGVHHPSRQLRTPHPRRVEVVSTAAYVGKFSV